MAIDVVDSKMKTNAFHVCKKGVWVNKMIKRSAKTARLQCSKESMQTLTVGFALLVDSVLSPPFRLVADTSSISTVSKTYSRKSG